MTREQMIDEAVRCAIAQFNAEFSVGNKKHVARCFEHDLPRFYRNLIRTIFNRMANAS